ncbi:MAG: hypothetical protein CME06_10475, partial [Gemmatimonadetes bacterium]|nr:hypothetical protein [Gemmatimonadota bacterium]
MKLPARALGIEFAEGRIHFVQMKRMFGPSSVTKMATLELSSATGEAEVAERMSAFLSEKGLRCRRVVAGIPLKDAMIRVIELPGVEEKHLRQMLEFEIERSFPISAAEAYFDYSLLEPIDDRARLLVVAVERTILERYKNLISEAGLPTMAITPAILAEIELPALRDTDSEISALIRSNSASTEVAVLARRMPAGIYRFTHPNGAGSTGNNTSPEQLVSRLLSATRQACTSATGVPLPTHLVASGRSLSPEVSDELARGLGIDEVDTLGLNLGLREDETASV